MLKLIIEDDEGRKTVVPFTRDEITIGRQEGNTIRLTERNVSRHHARLLRQNGHVLVEDLGSYNGVRINGERIQEPAKVKDGDLIQIGDYDLALQQEASAQPIAPTIRVPAASLQEAMDAARAQTIELPTGAEDELDEPPPEEEDGSEAASADQRRHSTAVIRVDQVEMNRPRRVANVHEEDAPRLVVVSPEFKGQEFSCIRTEMRVGRTDDNDIALDHRSLSRTHAKIVREESGEWRVIDMQSANGLTVNGESYAQAPLAHGDLLELGHVKLRFIGPGHNADGLLHDGAARGSKKGLFLALAGVVLLGAGAGAAWFIAHPPARTPAPPPVATTDTPPPEPTEPPRQAQTTPPEPPPEGTEPTPVPVPAADPFADKLKSAQAAMDARDFDTAVTTLESLKDAKGARPAKAEELLREATTERDAKRGLAKARQELDANKPQEAQKSLSVAEGSLAFATEYAALKEKVDAALKPPAKAGGTPTAAAAPEEATRLFTDGWNLLKEGKLKEADTLTKQCLSKYPTYAKCYLLMGATQARMGRAEEGAKSYREFLKYAAPDDDSVPKVKKLLETYDNSKSQPGGGK